MERFINFADTGSSGAGAVFPVGSIGGIGALSEPTRARSTGNAVRRFLEPVPSLWPGER
jgi:hypothetical protein